MFFNFSRNFIQLICVIMLLLIQFDVCTPLMDAISHQLELVENKTTEEADNENDITDEVYYRTASNNHANFRYLAADLCTLFKSLVFPALTSQDEIPIPESLGKSIQHHIIFCVYRI